MAVNKTTNASVRVPPDITATATVTAAAWAERRSLATIAEVLELDYCRTRSIPLPAADMVDEERAAPPRKKQNKTRKS